MLRRALSSSLRSKPTAGLISRKKHSKTVTPPTDPAERIDLPDISLWRNYFSPSHIKHRISVSNPRTAATLADTFVPFGSKDKVIIEAFPGE